jgi:hypothetical protein
MLACIKIVSFKYSSYVISYRFDLTHDLPITEIVVTTQSMVSNNIVYYYYYKILIYFGCLCLIPFPLLFCINIFKFILLLLLLLIRSLYSGDDKLFLLN